MKQDIDRESFYEGLRQMSKQVRSMIALCEGYKRKFPKLIDDNFLIEAIKTILTD